MWDNGLTTRKSSGFTNTKSYEGEVLVFLKAIFVFVLFKQLCETLQVNLMELLDVLAGWTGGLDNCNRFPH